MHFKHMWTTVGVLFVVCSSADWVKFINKQGTFHKRREPHFNFHAVIAKDAVLISDPISDHKLVGTWNIIHIILFWHVLSVDFFVWNWCSIVKSRLKQSVLTWYKAWKKWHLAVDQMSLFYSLNGYFCRVFAFVSWAKWMTAAQRPLLGLQCVWRVVTFSILWVSNKAKGEQSSTVRVGCIPAPPESWLHFSELVS